MNNRFKFFIFSVLILFCAAEVLVVQVQAGEVSLKDHQIETITVTAEKKAADIQDVSMSITAFSEMNLNDAGIDALPEIARFTPNVYMKRDSIIIRGISQYYGSMVSAAGFYLDGVSLPFEGINSSELFDIERIEILKGPQGTLYGKNSEAGVVNIITKQPGNEVRGKILGEYSRYDTEHGNSPGYIAGGSISGPLVKNRLYLGLAGKWKDYKGYLKNEYNGDEEAGKDEHFSGRLNLRWAPQDRWDISFIADVMNNNDNSADFKYVTGPLNAGRHKVEYDGPYACKKNGDGQTFRIKYDGDRFNVLSLTGRRQVKNDLSFDFDLTSVISPWTSEAYYKNESTSYSQEIRISSAESNNPFHWLTGFYAFDEDMEIYQKKAFQNGSNIRNTDVDNSGYAFFGQGTYTFIDRLHFTAGLRYDYTEFKGEQELTAHNSQTVYGKDFDDSEILPKLSISFDLSDKIKAYTSAARGYLTGGYNFKWATNGENLTYKPEYTWNYEVGLKSSWFDNRLIANMSTFYIEMKDKQVAEWDTTSGTTSVKQIQNAANAYSAGMELEIQARPARGLDLFAGFGFIEAKIDDWIATEYNGATGESYQYDYKDKKLPNVPEYTYNLGTQYRHMSGYFCRADFFGTGPLYSDTKNSAKEDGYLLANLRLGFESKSYDIIFWCKNLFDKEYLKVRFAGAGDHQGVEGEPRMIGATFTYRF